MNIAIILIILLGGAIFTYLSGNRFASKVAILFSVAAAVFSVALYLKYGAAGTEFSIEWIRNPNISFSLKADGLAIAMILLTTILLPIIILASLHREFKNEKLLYSLIMFMAFAMTGAFLSSDALLYYVFWEMSLIPIYFIIVLWGNGELAKRRKAAMTFFLFTFAGSLFMMAAIIYLYTKTGSFQLEAFYNANLSETEQIWIFLAFFLAYAIKIPVFPFHTWQANVYQKAPAVGTMLLAGIMSKMGAYSVIRWQIPMTPYASHEFRTVILILCIIGVVYGAIMALRQDDLKRFLAYASLSHVGFIAAGSYALTYDGIEGAVVLILAHGFGIVAMFYAADVIQNRTNTLKISELGGIKSHAPKFAVAFFLSILSSIGIPLTFNFIGEFTIMYGLYQVSLWFALTIGTSLFLGALFMLRMFQYTMLGEPSKKPFRDLSKTEITVFTLIVIVLIFFGVYVKPVTDLVSTSLTEIVMYINR
ncbi:NADH-quinone oxidoreductase subunit M [Dysgonomonas sp. PFB1-18]|uniref:complex I subunit 4 family protein n=1 Tax=unclassified Dysgonomonas TaxID=2630389 RepID=UPI0024767119|nr:MULTISPECIES: NADH-quinone oxidoreductase subunit M [unclassified Dysgonomonas]MDH6307925.1 NADH-quinone oxidoreductase subunit M [Dysgonomonas sp. PF1-14]MDH6337843.1 NADH-quinone oxidoreductase subunit M [Dysgonomonas sp. PF1-16]MDH6379067.1 NADH-quinone oxidoreductase subunit M [Dysgonomonas sp. PFB1-18]MDH6396702.1 NADH-quinone oxidoreductase subunit M [Dysgonomonas sp. PF1-23]